MFLSIKIVCVLVTCCEKHCWQNAYFQSLFEIRLRTAMLEVSALLHQAPVGSESLVRHCPEVYDVSVPAPETLDFSRGTDQARNTLKLIAEIRAQALKRADLPVYALMVFDHAMFQLGGLYFGVSCNKIASATDAVRLSALAARWLRDVLRTSSLREGEFANAESN